MDKESKMAGTIPEHDWTGKLQLERERMEQARERIEAEARERVREETRRELTSMWFKIAGVLVAAVIVGAFAEWGRWQAMESEFNQRIENNTREIARLQQSVEGIQGIRTDLAALGARFDAWRSSEAAANSQYRRQVDEQLGGIRAALEARHR
jgi:cytochrome c-type biogenesis protein CcmH/NrfG